MIDSRLTRILAIGLAFRGAIPVPGGVANDRFGFGRTGATGGNAFGLIR
ncbi:MAG: hypothetical protein NT070_10825 [Cyanobacteria bacterium]|nr:hypothetical protein [Cyanobacteriota bacterium]